MCPPNYLWQRYLEETFPTRTTTAKTPPSGDPKPEAASPSHSIDGDAPIPVFNVGNIAKKFALDQTLGAVVNTVLFLAVMGGLKGASGQEITDRVHKVSRPRFRRVQGGDDWRSSCWMCQGL